LLKDLDGDENRTDCCHNIGHRIEIDLFHCSLLC
jgi:hypothetical protein